MRKSNPDFLIAGAGGAGAIVANELATAGFQVVVLEQGPYLRERDFKHDELKNNWQYALTNDLRTQPNTFRKTESEVAKPGMAVQYGRCVGGGTGFADWPITYADLEPYYTKAEWELGVSGLAGVNPGESPRSKPYPLPPMAILSRNYRGRSACVHCGFRESFGCEVNAKSSTLATVIPIAEKTGRCEIRSGCYVRKIEIDKSGRATGAETPRLLLMSKSNRFPDGLANSSGYVGKHLMFTSGAFCGGLFEHPLNEYKSIPVTRVIHDFYELDPKLGYYGGGGIDTRFDFYPIGFALGALPPDMPKWGAGYKAALREYFTRSMFVLSHATSLPAPALRVTYRDHAGDIKTSKFFSDRSMELLDAAGAKKKWAFPVEEQTWSNHLPGTCRMGNDPKTSVVDRQHRAHDVWNLFIVDGSSFVTSGRGLPRPG